MKLKLDIENKILLPFMILAILPITILGIVSYVNGYQLLINDRLKSQEALLGEAVVYLEMIQEEVTEGVLSKEEGKSKAYTYFSRLNRSGMAIIDGQGYISKNAGWYTNAVMEKIRGSGGHEIDIGSRRYLIQKFEPWNWTIVMSVSKSYFPEELIEIQKYALLLTIIFLVLSMQSIIFIAHHISKPIKYFAEVCKHIELGNRKVKVNIIRSDEIGVLAGSFNHMIDQINTSTEKLIQMTKLNEDILKNIDIGIMTTDNSGTLMSLNQAGRETLTRYEGVPIMEELEEQILKMIESKSSVNQVISISSETGKSVYIDTGTSLMKKEDGSFYGVICSFNDITERKIIENNLVRMDRLASVGQFAAGLAHEIRNPLTGIKTGIQVIKNREISKNEMSNTELFDGLTYEIDRINSLVTDLLDFSKPKQTLREKENLCSSVRKSLELAKEGIIKKEISIEIHDGNVPQYAFVDKAQAEQIFLNIITNAVEAMDLHGKLQIKIKRFREEHRAWVRTVISDDGVGIDEAIRDKIFNPFFTTKAKGTGLGLVVVAKLIEENQGKIAIESQSLHGTKISIMLPEYWRDEN